MSRVGDPLALGRQHLPASTRVVFESTFSSHVIPLLYPKRIIMMKAVRPVVF